MRQGSEATGRGKERGGRVGGGQGRGQQVGEVNRRRIEGGGQGEGSRVGSGGVVVHGVCVCGPQALG